MADSSDIKREQLGTEAASLTYVWLDSLGGAEGRRFAFYGDGSDNRRQAVQEALRLGLERVTAFDQAKGGSSS